MTDLDDVDRCRACGSEERDEFVDGSIKCTDCGWPVLADAAAYAAMGVTPDGNKLPEMRQVWAPCSRCGLADARLPDEGAVDCQECGQVLLPWAVRDYTAQSIVRKLSRGSGSHRDRLGDDIRPGDSVVARDLVGGGPFTRLFVLAIHDSGEVDLVRDGDGTTWLWVPREQIISRV